MYPVKLVKRKKNIKYLVFFVLCIRDNDKAYESVGF